MTRPGILNPYAPRDLAWLLAWLDLRAAQCGVAYPVSLARAYEAQESARRAAEHD